MGEIFKVTGEIKKCCECGKEMSDKLMVFIYNPNGDFGWYCSYTCARNEMDGEAFLNGEYTGETKRCRDNDGCSSGVMVQQRDGTFICDVCGKRIY